MALLRYTLLRVALVVAVWVVFRFVFQIDGLMPWILAFVVAFLIAFIAFPRTGDAAAEQLHHFATGKRREAPPTEDELLEDAVADRLATQLQDEADSQQQGVEDLEEPGVPEDGDQRGPR